MRFLTPVAKRYTVVVRPARVVVIDGIREPQPGLRAKFRNGVFDSERAQQEAGWTDEERKIVEYKLLHHQDFQRQRGFYLERVAGQGLPAEVVDLAKLRCLGFFANEKGEPEQCPNSPQANSDYCAEHQIEIVDEKPPSEELAIEQPTGPTDEELVSAAATLGIVTGDEDD